MAPNTVVFARSNDSAELGIDLSRYGPAPIFHNREEFCRRLLVTQRIAHLATLVVIHGEETALAEFAQLMLASRIGVLVLVGLKPNSDAANRWAEEARRSWKVVLLEHGACADGHPRVAAAFNEARAGPGSLLRHGRLLYTPVNPSPWIPPIIDDELPLIRKRSEQHMPPSEMFSWELNYTRLARLESGLYLVCDLFSSVLELPEYTHVRLSQERLIGFLAVVETCYRGYDKKHYHDYLHAVDVVQAAMMILIDLGVFNVLSESGLEPQLAFNKDNVAGLDALDGLAVLVAAYGHDLLHPGLPHKLLRATSPAYRDQYPSLEAYHETFYSDILNHMWPEVMRMENVAATVKQSILVTDMQLHRQFMEAPSARTMPKMIIKAADISNAIRPTHKFGLPPLTATDDDPQPIPDERAELAVRIWHELRSAYDVAHEAGMDEILAPMVKAMSENTNMPEAERCTEIQTQFLREIALPYFTWLSKQFPDQLGNYVVHARAVLDEYESPEFLERVTRALAIP